MASDSSPKSFTTTHEQATILRALPSRSILQRPAHSPSFLASETLMRLILCSAQSASTSLMYSFSVQVSTSTAKCAWRLFEFRRGNDQLKLRILSCTVTVNAYVKRTKKLWQVRARDDSKAQIMTRSNTMFDLSKPFNKRPTILINVRLPFQSLFITAVPALSSALLELNATGHLPV